MTMVFHLEYLLGDNHFSEMMLQIVLKGENLNTFRQEEFEGYEGNFFRLINSLASKLGVL